MADIYDFIFYTVLKYDYSSSVLTGELQNDIIFGLLVPTIFIAFVLYFSVRNVFGAGHAAIGNLAAITGLGVVVTLGWVPIIAGLGGFVFVALLAILFIGSFYRRLVPEGAEMKLRGAAAKAGSMIDVGTPIIPPKTRRAYGVRLHGCETEYDDAVEAISTYKGGKSSGGSNVIITESKFEQKTEIERYNALKNHAVEKGVQIVENFMAREREGFINEFTKKDGEYNKQLKKYFKLQTQLENEANN